MRPSVVLVLSLLVSLEAVYAGKLFKKMVPYAVTGVGKLTKNLPGAGKLRENIASAHSTLDEIENEVGGMRRKLTKSIQKVKDVLATLDSYVQSNDRPRAGRDGSISQVQYHSQGAPVAGYHGPCGGQYGVWRASHNSGRAAPKTGISSAQVPFHFAERLLNPLVLARSDPRH